MIYTDMRTIAYLFCVFLLLAGCRTDKELTSVSAFGNFETVCLKAGHDGSLTVRAWGSGRDRRNAMAQAQKNVVHDIIFRGIQPGNTHADMRPLLTEVNAQEKYLNYFNRFFSTGGEYLEFVSADDENKTSRMKAINMTQSNYGCVIRVQREALRRKLIADGILRP